ncbi:MAG: FixG Ig-like domain-containing protein, partial [Ferrovibrio sp.]
RAQKQPTVLKLLRARTLLYSFLLVLVAAVMLVALMLRSDVGLSVQQERSPLYVVLSDGAIRNGYVVKVSNKTRESMHLRLAAEGLAGTDLYLAGEQGRHAALELVIEPDEIAEYHVFVRAPRRAGDSMASMDFVLRDDGGREVERLRTQFAMPK